MADFPRPIGVDATGYELLTEAALTLLAQYLGLDGREILFKDLKKIRGLRFPQAMARWS